MEGKGRPGGAGEVKMIKMQYVYVPIPQDEYNCYVSQHIAQKRKKKLMK